MTTIIDTINEWFNSKPEWVSDTFAFVVVAFIFHLFAYSVLAFLLWDFGVLGWMGHRILFLICALISAALPVEEHKKNKKRRGQ